jgi:hypothetical protein
MTLGVTSYSTLALGVTLPLLPLLSTYKSAMDDKEPLSRGSWSIYMLKDDEIFLDPFIAFSPALKPLNGG